MRAFIVGMLLGLGLIVVGTAPASAATSITEPSGNTIEVGIDDEGYAAAFTVKASGFEPYANVFVEVCNGRLPTADSWTPTIDCDLGSSPAAAVADEGGNVTFSASDPNHALFPFVGPGPQGLFNCLAANGASPGNLLDDFTDCQLRISTSNNEATTDQAFVTLALPVGAKVGWQTPDFPEPAATGAAAADGGNTARATGSARADSAADASSASSSGELADSSSGGSANDFPVLPLLLSIAVVVAGAAALLVLHKRRSGRVAA